MEKAVQYTQKLVHEHNNNKKLYKMLLIKCVKTI